MNKIFKVVKNQRTGNSVVASEFAKGAKKGKKLALLSLAMLMGCGLSVSAPAADPAGQWLETEYRPAQYDSTTKTWVNNSNEKEQSRVINDGSVKDLNLNNEKTKFTNNLDYHETWFSLQELWAKNTDANKVISITEYRDGVAVPGDASLNAIEDWQVPDNPSAMEEITWKKEDGETAVMQAYNTDAFKKTIDPQLGVYLLEKQPELSPFYHLTLAEVKDGTLNMTAADNVDWNINYIKDSSLFVAAADSGKSATIDTTSKLHVTFGEAYGMYLSSGEYKYTFQPQNELVESVAIPKELNGFTSKGKTYALGDTFAIGNAQGLAAYNALLIDAVTHNVLPGAEYKALIEATVVPRPQDKDYFDVNIDLKGLEDKDIRLNKAITADIGRRSIFEAAGDGSVLNIKDGADIRGETSSNSGRYRAYHIFAHDGAKVFHDATTSVPNYKGQNALIDNAEFTNRGTLLLGDGKTRIYGDQVTGENAHYTNLGTIAVEAFNLVNNDPTDKDVIANTGVTASGGSLVTNEKGGKLLLGQKGIGKNEGTVTGVQVKGASFINNGDILMGKDDVSLSGGREDDTWDMRIMSNAVAALLDETAKAGEKYAIENKGKIDINKGVSNAVGINVASTPNRNADSQLTVVNNGEIDVAGTNTVGMRVSGTNRVKDVIENNGTINVSGAGSIGLLALGDSTITHHGQVIATNNGTTTGGTKPARTTGVRADDAKVIIDGGTVELKGNNTVGVFARVGGEIDLNSGHVIFDKNSINQTGYWIAGRKGADETFSSRINFGASDVALTLDNNDSTLFRVDQKAQFLGDSSKGTTYTFDINGEKSRGFYIADNGTEVKTGNMQLNVNGNDATGLYLANGAGADGKVVLDKETTISVTGEGGTIAVIDGNYYDINGNATGKKSDKTTLTSKAHLKSGGTDDNIAKNAIGYKLINGGVLNHDGNIDFSKADNATGIRVETGTVNNTTDITVNGVGVDIYGRNSVVNNTGNITANNGTAAVRLNKDASMTIGGKGKILGENSADAVRAHSGSNVKLDNANIEVTGSGSGLHLLNTDDDSGAFKLSGTGTINVSGENASGLKLEADDGKGGVMMAKSKLDTSGAGGTTINVKDKGGNGIVTNTSGDVISGMNVNIESAEGESALVVLGGTKNITQSGKLTSASDHSVVDLTALRNDFSFTNSGTVTAGASGMAVDAHQNSNIRFTNGGTISGKSVLGGGNNTIALSGNTSDIATGHGDNTIEMLEKAVTGILTAGNGNNTVTLNGGTKLQTGTVGNGQNNVILKNVSEAQSDALFGNLKAGSGGQDALTLQGKASHYVLQDSSKISGFEKLNIEEGRFELRNTDITLNELTADDGITVKQGGELFINQNKADTFAHQLQGDGLVTTSTAGQAFDFNNKSAAFAGDNFTGTLRLTNGTFDIAGDNTRALQKSRLDIGDKSVATVRAGVGTQSFDRLAMSGGTLALQAEHIGSAAIENAGTLVLTHNDGKQPWDLTNSVTGTGTLVKQGAGRITLTDKSAQYTGATEIQNGTLQAGSYDSALVMNSRQVNIGTQGIFAGQGTLKGSVNNAGQFYVGEPDKKDLGQATDYRVDGNFVNNGGSIWLASQKETESRLNVGGDFTANGGSITLNTVLNRGHEDTMTDQLVVDGNVYTGKNGATTLNINNVGGEGADTLKQPDAIKVVHVGGKSDKNAFKLGGPVAIGVYEYLLHKGYKDDSWYLDSFDTNVYPPDENKEDPNRNVNPEIGGHMANRTAALGMFSMTLHDRLGEPHYADSFKGDENASSVWLRITGDRQRQDAVSRSLRLKGDTYTTQLGGDIINWNNDAQDTTIRGGIMGAIGKSDYTSSAKRTGTKADAKIDRAYSVGLYGTWYQNREDENNAYADVWAQYSWFDNKVSMAGSSSDYKSRLVSASVETGYSMAVYKPDADKQWLLTPQAQVIFNSYDSDDSSSGTGLVMKGGRSNSVDTRLGARLTYANQKQSDKSAQPFVEVNWLHSTAKSDMTFNKHYTFSDDRPANRFEIKAGVEGQISPNWTVWGNVSHQMGADDYSGDRAMIGVKYQWK